jgi:hypothetical protein
MQKKMSKIVKRSEKSMTIFSNKILGMGLICLMMLFGTRGSVGHVSAQDALNLPTELYILLNEGRVERYGLGNSGRAFVTPEDAFVLDFQVAPDGIWLAYRTQEGLFIDDMYDERSTPRPLAGADIGIPYARGRGETIAWTHDSTAIAYTTIDGGGVYFLEEGVTAPLDTPTLLDLQWSPDGRYLAVRAEEDVWWIYRRDEKNMILTSAITSGTSATWLDLTRLAFTPADGGLVLMDMADANAQTVLLPAPQVYALPKRLDDTTLLIFAQTANDTDAGWRGRLQQISLTVEDINVMTLGEFDVSLEGVRWAPSPQILTAFRGGVLALVDALSGQGFTLPITSASAYGWGASYPPIVAEATLPQPATYLAPDATGITQVWQVDSDGSLPRTITPATANISAYAISPNGQNIAYVSGGSLWLLALNDPEADSRRLVALGTNREVMPAFSPDNERIYYRDEQGAGSGIWVIPISGGEATLFILDYDVAQHYNPQPSLSVSAMVVTVRSPETPRNGILLVDTTSGEQAFLGNYTQAIWLDNSELLVEGFLPRSDMPFTGLHIIDVNNLEEPPFTVFPLLENMQVLDVQRRSDALRILLRPQSPGMVRVLDVPRDGGTPALVDNIGYLTQPRLANENDFIIGLTHSLGNLVAIDLAQDEKWRVPATNNVSQLKWR